MSLDPIAEDAVQHLITGGLWAVAILAATAAVLPALLA